MPPKFNGKLKTGIKEIDKQHMLLFNTMQKFSYRNKTNKVLWDIFMEIERYARLHFDTEEEYMRKYEYPFYNEHKVEHQKFTDKFEVIRKDFEKTGFSEEFVNNFQSFMLDWFDYHYTNDDVKFAAFLKEKQI
jgi:hemerythrin